MLVRVLVKNLFSFNELTEFNMLPGKYTRLSGHVYKTAGLEVLKLNAMYGANGAGKSNLIKAVSLLKDCVMIGKLPLNVLLETFKFDPEGGKKDSYIGIEFISGESPYYYALTFNQGIIVEEELLISGLEGKEDRVLFSRKDNADLGSVELFFDKVVMEDREASLFPTFLKNEMLERNVPVLHYMGSRKNPVFEIYKHALYWFRDSLVTIMPYSWVSGLPLQLEQDRKFFEFANEVMKSYSTGIVEVNVDTIPIEDFFGQDDRQRAEWITAELRSNPNNLKSVKTHSEEVVFVLENERAYAKSLYFIHETPAGRVKFVAAEESDGTRRLLDYLPAFYFVNNSKRVYLIDEIERSIHPLLIKELVRNFSHNEHVHGQLIFSTHESNLLDQEIFRPDEIWFAEKKVDGATELYSLSEFKEHHTIDIRKGYLTGRYGGIPFLGNLKDLNWEKYAEADQV